MKYISVLALLITTIIATTAFAAGPSPSIFLSEGTQTVSLSVVNNGNADLAGVRIVFDKQDLPDWLSIHENDQALAITRGSRSETPFVLTFEASNPPSGISFDIPYTLIDDSGGEWQFSLQVMTGQNMPAFETSLASAYPNPFNPSTSIRYSLKASGQVRLMLYNSLGQQVRSLVDSPQSMGFHTVVWDGRDDSGRQVSSGVYFCRMEAGRYVKTMKMTMME